MVRVTELFRGDASCEISHSSGLLTRGLGQDFQVEQRALSDFGRIRAVAHTVRTLRETRPDVVHAWGMQPLLAAAISGVPRIIYSPPCLIRRGDVKCLRTIMAYRHLQIVCATEGQRRRLIRLGVAASQCDLIRPGFDCSSPTRDGNAADLRRRLGLADDDHVILLAGQATPDTHHRDAVWAIGILHVLDPRYKVLIWGEGAEAASVERFSRRIGTPDVLRSAGRRLGAVPFATLLPAADLVLASDDGSVESLPLIAAMMAGKPIVAVAGQTTSELLEHRRTAMLVPTCAPRLLARQVQELQADPSLQRSLADAARAHAGEFHTSTNFISQWRHLLHKKPV